MEIIPLISLAELKKPSVPTLVIWYDLYPSPNRVGTNKNIKYKNNTVRRVILLIFISSFIEYSDINNIGKKKHLTKFLTSVKSDESL